MKEIRNTINNLRKLIITKEKQGIIKLENFQIIYKIIKAKRTPAPRGF